MGAWNLKNVVSKKDLAKIHKETLNELHKELSNVLMRQKKSAEHLNRKLNTIQINQIRMNEKIVEVSNSMAFVEELIYFAMANKIIDNLELVVEGSHFKKSRNL